MKLFVLYSGLLIAGELLSRSKRYVSSYLKYADYFFLNDSSLDMSLFKILYLSISTILSRTVRLGR